MTLSLEGLGVRYGSRVALEPTSAELRRGELVGLIGPNGAGKSSLLKAAAGLIPHGGTAAWQGTPVTEMGRRERARTIAYLPQTAAAQWPIEARDLVALGRLPHRAFGERPSRADADAVSHALEQCEAGSLARRRVDTLSGGERARVLLARALAVGAPALLVDEPVQSLDPYHQLKIMSVLRRHAGPETLVVAVLHDVTLAARFCTRVVMLADGRIADDGPPGSVLTHASIARCYRVEAYLARHRDEPVLVPWRPLD